MRVADKLGTGIRQVNGPIIHDEAHMPLGGVKASGYGRLGGASGVAEFTELRWDHCRHPAWALSDLSGIALVRQLNSRSVGQ